MTFLKRYLLLTLTLQLRWILKNNPIYSKVPNNRGPPPLIIFGKIFRTPPLLLEPPRLLIFDYLIIFDYFI